MSASFSFNLAFLTNFPIYIETSDIAPIVASDTNTNLGIYNNKYNEPHTTNIIPRTPKNKSFAKKYDTTDISLDNLCVNDAVFNLLDT